ncbi:hypothetical protein DL93DRAFT_371486 [Clavulina sp. PMI_390]|nr:hypothetical protein DL93DRAFT_371486 [Clavulina sp. PMI_390]
MNPLSSAAPSMAGDRPQAQELNLTSLPDDVLINIFSQSLTPVDVISLSHTSQMLRSFTSLDVIWRRALLYRPAHIPNFLPLHFSDLSGTSATRGAQTPTMEGYTSVEVAHDLSHPSPSSLREKYFDALRARKALCEPNVCIEKTKLVVDFEPQYRVRGMGLTIAGEVFWVCFDQSIQLFDLRGPKIISYNVELSDAGDSTPPIRDYRPMWPIVEFGRWREEEGVVLVANSLNRKRLEVFFQPMRRRNIGDDPETVSQPVFMYQIKLPSIAKKVSISGQYLIVFMRSTLKIIDMTSPKRVFLLQKTPHPENLLCEVFNDEFLLTSETRSSSPTSTATIYPLHAFQDDGGSLERTYARSGFLDGQLLSIPRSLSFNAATSHEDMCFWVHRTDQDSYDPLRVKFVRASTNLSNLPNRSRGSTFSHEYPIELLYPELKQPFLTRSVSKQAARKVHKTPTEVLERVAVRDVSSVQGCDRLLSVISSCSTVSERIILEDLGLHGERWTIVVTGVAPDGESLVHKSLFVLNTSGDQMEILSDGDRKQFAWNEASGRIAIKSWEELDDEEGASESPATIRLYQLRSATATET